METTKKYPSAVRDNVYEWTKEIKDVDVLVGIPCYNNEDTIAQGVTSTCMYYILFIMTSFSPLFSPDGESPVALMGKNPMLRPG